MNFCGREEELEIKNKISWLFDDLKRELTLYNVKLNFVRNVKDVLEKYGINKHVFVTSVWLETGGRFYMDGKDYPESNTPLIDSYPGHASLLTDVTIAQRILLLETFQKMKNPLTKINGYSSHENISILDDQEDEKTKFVLKTLHGLDPAFTLFLRNKYSKNPMRYEGKKDTYLINDFFTRKRKRYHIIGDYITDKEQLTAEHILLESTIRDVEKGDVPDFLISSHPHEVLYKVKREGRKSKFELLNFSGYITTEELLKNLYDFSKKELEKIATPEEIELLEAFVYGDRKTDMERGKISNYRNIKRSYIDENGGIGFVKETIEKIKEHEMFGSELARLIEMNSKLNGKIKLIPNWFEIKLIFNDVKLPLHVYKKLKYSPMLRELTITPENVEIYREHVRPQINKYV